MSTLPIIHMTLYKHGVGYYRRRAQIEGESLKLSFRREEMDDLLKSLTVIDHSGGQVRGIDYDTPQSQQERLAGCSVILNNTRSLRDLLVALRGRKVQLLVKNTEPQTGILVGLDESKEKPQKISLVSLLVEETNNVTVFSLSNLEGVTLQDSTAAGDLRFFLQTALGQETHRSITVRLNPGEHDLEVSYIAPAPTWRVSYRLVMETDETDTTTNAQPKALLQGWGIFDNRLEEDLNNITLSLTAGMPISFVYDLYTPHTPERPVVEAEKRVAAGPILLESAVADEGVSFGMAAAAPPPAPKMAARSMSRGAPQKESMIGGMAATKSAATGQALGELFQYNVDVPVTVGRGQSAMVPIVSSMIDVKKNLIYNARKMPTHPIATLRFNNETGLTLEHGPVTVLENSEYVGEAVLAFTVNGAEAVTAYAVELGIHIQEEFERRYELNSLNIKEGYLLRHEYEIQQTTYKIDNRTNTSKKVLLEHPAKGSYTVFDTPDPAEKTLGTYRYEVEAPTGKLSKFTVKERYLRTHYDELKKLSYQNLQRYLKDKFLDEATYQKLNTMLQALEKIGDLQARINQQEVRRKQIYTMQEQAQKNMGVLSNEGEEGKLRGRYVTQISQSETELTQIEQTIKKIQADIKTIQAEVEQMIAGLSA